MNEKKGMNSTDVGRRIKETKQEIAHLSEELERLIKSNLGRTKGNNITTIREQISMSNENLTENLSNFNNNNKLNHSNITIRPKTTDNELVPKQSPSVRSLSKKPTEKIHSKPCNSNGEIKTNVGKFAETRVEPETVCRKNRFYDRDSTKEYIKHQREKWEEEKKKTDCKLKIDQESKKQKLNELHQKSLAIVQRNIMLKRERSRSRDNRQNIRLDRYSSDKQTPRNTAKTSTEQINRSRKPQVPKLRKIDKLDSKVEIQYMGDPVPEFKQKTSSRNDEAKGHCLEVPSFNYLGRKSFMNPGGSSTNIIDENNQATKIQALYRGYRVRKEMKSNCIKQTNPETFTEKKEYVKESKETQTNQQQDQSQTPNWLREPHVDPYPCNFINAIKRKLQFVVNSPVVLTDAGLHRSKLDIVEPDQKSEGKLLKNLKGSNSAQNLKSNISHRCSNLDADALKHLALVHGDRKSRQTSRHNLENQKSSDNGSESDTSKNIPEISTESENISKHSKTQTNLLVLDTEKIKKLTLRDPAMKLKSSSRSSIISFNKSEYDGITQPKSPLDSIISFNRSNYDKLPPVSPDNPIIYAVKNSEKPSSSSRSSSSEEIKTETDYNSSRREEKSSSNHSSSENHTKENNQNPSNVTEVLDAGSSFENKRFTETIKKNKVSPQISTENIPTLSQLSKNTETENKKATDSEISEISKVDSSSEKNEEIYSMNFSSEPSNSLMHKNEKSNSKSSLKNHKNVDSHRHSNSSDDASSEILEKLGSKNFVELCSSNFSSGKSCEEVDNIQQHKKTHHSTKTIFQKGPDSNQIHLKFEAEVHLLNDFNESLKQLIEVEKAFDSIKNKNEENIRTQGNSTTSSNKSKGMIALPNGSKNSARSIASSINLSRGSDFGDSFISQDSSSIWKLNSTGLELSTLDDSNFNKDDFGVTGLSLCMFKQFIEEEDVRIKNLKMILKIREKALLDRTKSELAWLEVQRKHLKETGNLQEASLVKKKQRGILLRHQQEHLEMKRLKQLQENKSKERKIKLKEQRNVIKAKLFSSAVMPELKIQTPRVKNQKGPMKVLKNTESVVSETSISRKASDGEEIISITSKSQSFRLSEIDSSRELVLSKDTLGNNEERFSSMNKALLARQAALMKRRQDVEELLKKHKKLLEEEKKIQELENVANAVIMKIPVQSKSKSTTKLKIKRQELNELEVFPEKRFSEDKTYSMSKSSYDKLFSQIAEQQVEVKTNSNTAEIVSEKYSNDFETDTQISIPEENLSSIDELIEDFSKIEEDISKLSQNEEIESMKDVENAFNISCAIEEKISLETPTSSLIDEEETSVIHTQKTSIGNQDPDETLIVPEDVIESALDKTYLKDEKISDDSEIPEKTMPQIESNEENLVRKLENVVHVDEEKSITVPELNETFIQNDTEEGESIYEQSELSCEETECLTNQREEVSKILDENVVLSSINNIPSIEQTSEVLENISIPETKNEEICENFSQVISSEPQSNDLKLTTDHNGETENNENFEGISSLFRSEKQIEEEENTSEISENLLTDSDYEQSTENYSEDFEDENSTENNKNNEVKMMQIHFNNSENDKKEAEIVVLGNELLKPNDVDSKKINDVGDKEIASEFSESIEEIIEEKSTKHDVSPTKSPESPKQTQVVPLSIFGNEAEELLKKQMAIEQEIKHLEQQQKERLPFVYMREIPNKPPPPYTPPSGSGNSAITTVLPSKIEDLDEICNYSSKVLYNAYLSNNLNKVTFSETHFKSINRTESTKECCLFVFDLCREVAKKHYDKFEKKNEPAWMKFPEETRLFLGKPYDYPQLEKHINTRVKELLGFEKRKVKENSIIKWSRKRRDHVDDILIMETLEEEQDWLNHEKDELMVKNELVDEIFNFLLLDTLTVFEKMYL